MRRSYGNGQARHKGVEDEVLVGGAPTEFAAGSCLALVEKLDQGLTEGLCLDHSIVVGDSNEAKHILSRMNIPFLNKVSLESF